MTLRILHVTHTLEFGVGLSAVRFAADQTARGWDVTLACPDDPLEAR